MASEGVAGQFGIYSRSPTVYLWRIMLETLAAQHGATNSMMSRVDEFGTACIPVVQVGGDNVRKSYNVMLQVVACVMRAGHE
jgi:hypothetical protein